jgi:hypothetical protein
MPSAVGAPDDTRLKLKYRDTSGITYFIRICLASEIGQLGLGCEVLSRETHFDQVKNLCRVSW